jgi:predicted PurR-regulated permease PerM
MASRRSLALAGLGVGFTALAAFALRSVLATAFFAATVAYVLYPLRSLLVSRGLSRRTAAGAVTALALAAVVALLSPVGFALYERRAALFAFVSRLPDAVTLSAGEFAYTLQTAPLVAWAETALGRVAVATLRAAPVLALKFVVFTLSVYALLYQPRAVGAAVDRLVPARYHDVVASLHERTRATLRAIYVLQAATALATFAVAFAVFSALGYRSPFALAVVAGVLQFVPVVGPSVVVLALATVDAAAGAADRALAVLVLGLLLVGFLPDALVRTRLAGWAADLPASLYFVGFVGGVLSLGVVGFVAGPLLVALLVETVALLSADVGASASSPSE